MWEWENSTGLQQSSNKVKYYNEALCVKYKKKILKNKHAQER